MASMEDAPGKPYPEHGTLHDIDPRSATEGSVGKIVNKQKSYIVLPPRRGRPPSFFVRLLGRGTPGLLVCLYYYYSRLPYATKP